MDNKFELPDVNSMLKEAIEKVTNRKVGLNFATKLAEKSADYTPYDTGNLLNSLTISPFELTYNCDYAEALYESDIMFLTEKHPLATNHWVEVAFTTHKDEILSYVQKEM